LDRHSQAADLIGAFANAFALKDFLLLSIQKVTQVADQHQLSRRWQCLKCGSDVDNAVPKPLEKLREDLSARAEHFEKAVSLMRIGRGGKPA
jgi:hypothetical protein